MDEGHRKTVKMHQPALAGQMDFDAIAKHLVDTGIYDVDHIRQFEVLIGIFIIICCTLKMKSGPKIT